MAFLPDGRLLVTEKRGALKLTTRSRRRNGDVTGVPAVEYGGQGGFGDVVLHPDFAANGLVYLSYAEPGERGSAGAAVARARLRSNDAGGGALENLTVIWRQTPKVDGRGHYGHRIAFGPDGFLYISSGERQKFTPAQDMQQNLGKIVRLNEDGSVPATIRSQIAAASPRRSGRSAIAIRSGSLSMREASSGMSRWARRAATS